MIHNRHCANALSKSERNLSIQSQIQSRKQNLKAKKKSEVVVYINPDLLVLITSNEAKVRVKKSFVDHYLYFCGTVFYLKYGNKKFKDTEYVPINSMLMRSLISQRHYDMILLNLESWGVISVNNSYSSGKKSKSFKLNPQYCKEVKAYQIKDKTIVSKVLNFRRKKMKNIQSLPEPYQYLQMTSCWLNIDEKKALQFNISNYSSDADQYKFNSNFYAINAISTGNTHFSVDTFGNRAHSNLTNLSSELRQFLSVHDASLGEIDIKNSQPLFFFLVIKDQPGISEKEKESYRQLVEDASFYEFFMEEFKIPSEKRDQVKVKVLTEIFFNKNKPYDTKFFKHFKKSFPDIASFIRKVKKEDYTNLARLLQRAESKFVIEKAVARFIQRFGQGYEYISTIHDSIVVKKERIPETFDIVLECFREEGINPQVKKNYFEP